MGTLNEDLSAIKEVEDKIIANKVARFAYTDEAYTTNDADGVAEYDVNKEQNIPTADASVLKVNETVLSRGYRAQASSVTRMLLNHFFGRMSYNLNKVNDIVSNLIATLIGHRGTANGFATLDENGRIPYSQLPESAMEYKGQWNAETNTPTLADGTGTKGDFYIVSVGGTQNLGSGNIQFSANDRIIYDGSVWARLSAGDVKTVNSVLPTNGNVALTGENIPVSSTDPTLLSAPLTTDRYADSSITNEKIKEPISVANGGTGATTARDAFMNLANGLSEDNGPLDTEYVIYKNTDGTHWGLYTLSTFWEYIKGKISSVLGLTKDNYGGKSAQAGYLNNYSSTRITSGNIVPKDASEYGGMRKDVVTTSMTDSGRPGMDGQLLTMFWDTSGTVANQLFISNEAGILPILKVRQKQEEADYGSWIDIITSSNIGSQTVITSLERGAYDHIVYDDASLLEWANCTNGSMKKVLVKSGTYNMTKGVNLTSAGTGYVLAEQGAVIKSHVPVAFEKTNNALCSIYNLVVVCCVSENSSYCTAFKDSYSSHVFNKYLVLYNCKAGYDTVKLCNDYLFLSCWCFNCIFDAVSNTTTGMSVKIFSGCYCTNCVCTLSIQGTTLFEESDFFRNCTCINCRGDIKINVEILYSDEAFCAFHYCYCIACDAVFTCATPSLSVQSPCYCFNGGTRMSSCYAFADSSSTSDMKIVGINDCSYISATKSNNWQGLNSKVDADSCDNS